MSRLAAVLLIGLAVGWAGSQGGATAFGVPIFGLCVALAFLIQWLAFLPAYGLRSERFFDLTGSLTYLTVTALGVVLTPDTDARAYLLAAMVMLWAGRLGTFLFVRVLESGGDARFDEIKGDFGRFLFLWTLQGLWVALTLGPALAAVTSSSRPPLGWAALVGSLVWMSGFVVEVVADEQKRRFRKDESNRGRFISHGLWAWSRHPNYFGEIVLWTGIAIIAVPALEGWPLATLVSPAFVALLLVRISGIPLLEERADARWGGQPEYEGYKARTPVLVPRRPSG